MSHSREYLGSDEVVERAEKTIFDVTNSDLEATDSNGDVSRLTRLFEPRHAVIGADLLKKYNDNPEVIHAVRSHHNEEDPKSIMAVLVVVMPLGMFMVVQVFSDNETIGPELPMLLILLIFLLSLGFTIVQAFRLKRTRRRIKLLDEK